MILSEEISIPSPPICPLLCEFVISQVRTLLTAARFSLCVEGVSLWVDCLGRICVLTL